LNSIVREVKRFTESQLALIKKLTEIGVALSAEKNLYRLFEMIVEEAREFSHADGGTLYIMSDDEEELRFTIVQNDTLKVRMGGTGAEITWPPVKLRNPDGSPNYANVSAYVALSGKVVNIPDVYTAEGFNFAGTKRFDGQTGYRSKSMLVVPLKDHEGETIGVLQLLNAKDPNTGEVISFSTECQRVTESLASQAAIALSNNRLIHELELLLESFITSTASAIDEKSPYTGGHVRRVAELTMAIAYKINEMREGPFASVTFDADQLKELRMAAWLHDLGKITTPEHIIDKATKLQTVYDRIELLKTRFEVIKRDYEIQALKENCTSTGRADEEDSTLSQRIAELESEMDFLERVNWGGEIMADEMIEKLKKIALRRWDFGGKPYPLITEEELYNLSIRKGTLTEEERDIINNHAMVTHKMLSKLPFPKKLRNVPLYAAAHHEKLDGSGYPFGLKGEEIPLQAKIIALADIFEALTAKDRPYKKGNTLSSALKVMSFMVKDNHLDADLFNLFLQEKIYLDYARQELLPEQIDMA